MNDSETLKAIGNKLKELRISKNNKQSELSEKTGLSCFTISMMENGKNTSVLSLIHYLQGIGEIQMLDKFMKENTQEKQRVSK